MKTSNMSIMRGATFSRFGKVAMPAGTWNVSANVKTSEGVLVDTIDCTLTPITVDENGNNHSILLEVPSTRTVAWPINTLVSSLRFQDSSVEPVVMYSEKFHIMVQEGI